MRDINRLYGPWCLLAGAAEGLGQAFSETLAERGMNIIMVDHQKDLVTELGGKLEKTFGIRTMCLDLDLAGRGSVPAMMDAISETSCRMIIYNAAFSRVKTFLGQSDDDLDRYIEVNMRSPLQLARAFAEFHSGTPNLRKGVVLMSSMAALWGSRLLAPYGASKAFNYILAEALHHELKTENVDVMACIAGMISTPAFLESGPRFKSTRPSILSPEYVAKGVLDAIGRKTLYIPGFRNKLAYLFMTRMIPRRTAVRLYNRAVSRMYRDKD